MKCIFITFILLLFSCTSKKEGKAVAKVKALPKMEETFPFSEADRIEVISYPVRYEWDTIRKGKRKHLGSLVENKKMVNSSGIKEIKFLNDKLRMQLFQSLFLGKSPDTVSVMCYDPRHAVLFYNEKAEIIANVELCFDCARAVASFKHNDRATERISGTKKVFEQAGIKYYGEGQE